MQFWLVADALWFIKISLVDTAEMRETLVTWRVSGRWL